MRQLWGYVVGGALLVKFILYMLWRRAVGQRNAAREEAQTERDNRNVVERIRDKEGDIREAQGEAREEATANAEDIDANRQRGERTRGLDNDRL